MSQESNRSSIGSDSLRTALAVGDLVFIRVPALPFRWVARATGSWTNHVGLVVDLSGAEPIVAESRFPWSCKTTLSNFIGRSEGSRVAVTRLTPELDEAQRQRIRAAAERRLGIVYDTGFNLHSRRQFCSRFVREVIGEATGILIGEVETFAALLLRQPQSPLLFWRVWYFGRIPWRRETVSPASLLSSKNTVTLFDGAWATVIT